MFGYYEPEPPAKKRPHTSASKNNDIAGDLSNQQNYHYKQKAYNREPIKSCKLNYLHLKDHPAKGFVSKHPESQVPSTNYDPPPKSYQKPPTNKPPPFEDFFPAVKKPENPKRKIHPESKQYQKPPKTTPNREPKKKLKQVFENKPKPSYEKPKARDVKPAQKLGGNIETLGQETIPYQLKNTNQKIAAIEQINNLIGDVTDMTIMRGEDQRREDIKGDIEDEHEENEIYG